MSVAHQQLRMASLIKHSCVCPITDNERLRCHACEQLAHEATQLAKRESISPEDRQRGLVMIAALVVVSMCAGFVGGVVWMYVRLGCGT